MQLVQARRFTIILVDVVKPKRMNLVLKILSITSIQKFAVQKMPPVQKKAIPVILIAMIAACSYTQERILKPSDTIIRLLRKFLLLVQRREQQKHSSANAVAIPFRQRSFKSIPTIMQT